MGIKRPFPCLIDRGIKRNGRVHQSELAVNRRLSCWNAEMQAEEESHIRGHIGQRGLNLLPLSNNVL